MNYISFRVLFLGIFLPAIFYIFSVQVLEAYLQNKENHELQNTIIRDYEALYGGRYGIEEEIRTNIDRYRDENILKTLGVKTKIVVTTKKGTLLYPRYGEERGFEFDGSKESDAGTDALFNYIKTAEKNFQTLNEGLVLSVDVRLKHNSWLTNGILLLYLFTSVFIIYWYYKRRATQWDAARDIEVERLDLLEGKLAEQEQSLQEVSEKESGYIKRIEDLKEEREHLESDVARLQNEVKLQKKKSLEIDEVLEEMESLEEQAKQNIALKEDKELEILQLREEIDQLKKLEKQDAKKRKKAVDALERRFSALYKNVVFHRKALDGYSSLPQDFQLKAEEVIHRLNEDESQVDIRRKVFSKKGKLPVLEVLFAYSGRIYLERRDDRKIEILAIGTKNTQDQDIAFIEGMF
ncbi:MAG: hypothetical protein ACOC6B_06150 [Thermodesulfobacteriota bacterium]